MAEQEQNRTEPATPFKLEEAKKQGQVAKSLDFNAFVAVGAFLLMLLIWGEGALAKLAQLCAWLFQNAANFPLDRAGDAGAFGELPMMFLGVVLPLAGVGIVCAVLANLIQTGPIFTFVPLKPKFERINPVAGFKRVFNKRMLFETLKTLLKLGIFAAILYGFLVDAWPSLQTVATSDLGVQLSWLAEQGTALLLRLGLAMLFIALLDLAYTRWSYGQQMMMSRRELQQEIKRREGDPLIRAKLRELQRENLKQAQSLGRVPDADLLITNPEHFAIALRYRREAMSAPMVIAKGRDAWALSMKAVAKREGIPVFERKPLARKLFRSARIDQPVAPDTYVDVARVYAELEAQRRQLSRYEVAG